MGFDAQTPRAGGDIPTVCSNKTRLAAEYDAIRAAIRGHNTTLGILTTHPLIGLCYIRIGIPITDIKRVGGLADFLWGNKTHTAKESIKPSTSHDLSFERGAI
jgi:hypothetical protein